MNWFRSQDLTEMAIDLHEIRAVMKQDEEEDEEYLILLLWINEEKFYDKWRSLFYHSKIERDNDYEKLCKQLMKITVVSKEAYWTLDVKDLVLRPSSKEEKK